MIRSPYSSLFALEPSNLDLKASTLLANFPIIRPNHKIPLPSPFGAMVERPIHQRSFETNVPPRIFAHDPLVPHQFFAFTQELVVRLCTHQQNKRLLIEQSTNIDHLLCGIIEPTPAAPSFLVGRFQGKPLKSAGGGTALRLLGSGDSHETNSRLPSTTSIIQMVFISVNGSENVTNILSLIEILKDHLIPRRDGIARCERVCQNIGNSPSSAYRENANFPNRLSPACHDQLGAF